MMNMFIMMMVVNNMMITRMSMAMIIIVNMIKIIWRWFDDYDYPTDQNIVDGVSRMFSQPGGVQDELLLAVLWIFQFDIFIRKYPIFLSENILMYPNADHIVVNIFNSIH